MKYYNITILVEMDEPPRFTVEELRLLTSYRTESFPKVHVKGITVEEVPTTDINEIIENAKRQGLV